MPSAESVVELHGRWRLGDRSAGNLLFSVAFHRLRAIASALLHGERPGHTLQATALVNEFYLKFCRAELRILDAEHFFSVAARAMRQVLVDHARSRNAAKRISTEMIPDLLTPAAAAERELALAAKLSLEKLKRLDPQVAATVELRCIEGATIQEAAALQGIEPWRVRNNYDFGLEWMSGELSARR
jgi:RNA polymerase sigma factor (TIGR02999 family)